MARRLLPAVANIYVPPNRTLQCPVCFFWYQENAGHGCAR